MSAYIYSNGYSQKSIKERQICLMHENVLEQSCVKTVQELVEGDRDCHYAHSVPTHPSGAGG